MVVEEVRVSDELKRRLLSRVQSSTAALMTMSVCDHGSPMAVAKYKLKMSGKPDDASNETKVLTIYWRQRLR
jgi:hypothetical protein